MDSKTFLITGVSTGLGRAMAEAALNAGHRVIGTVRNSQAVSEFESLKPGLAHARQLDVTDTQAVFAVVKDIETNISPIDVLINNAGYGHEGLIEESPLDELRKQFEVNVFGAVAVIKAVLPFMRQRRSGHIINVTSMGGRMTMPGVGYYHGSKFALEGISGTLAKEVKNLGIFVTALEPGSFRTDWAGRSMIRTERSISDYDDLFNPIRATREARSGHQPGDPAKAGQAILQLVASANPPTRLLLGTDALDYVTADLKSQEAEIKEWESLTRSTNYDG